MHYQSFHQDFYPTPLHGIEMMCGDLILQGKIAFEPHAGRGDIVDYLLNAGADVIACETNKDLQKIIKTKCKLIKENFFDVTREDISHVDYIIMNPPFSDAVKHVLHAWEVAPDGCKIVTLLNQRVVDDPYSRDRKTLATLIDDYGSTEELGNIFYDADRYTNVEIVKVTLLKPAKDNYNKEFEGFFLEGDPEEEQANSVISYNVVRDLVNRYIAAVKLFDEQLSVGYKMGSLLRGFYGESLVFTCTENGAPKLRNEFKKDLQKSAWMHIFTKMNLDKLATRNLKEDINRFVEKQTQIPFTMRNVYKMLEIVVGTSRQRMDRTLEEVFNKITSFHHDNRLSLPGYKTNSHFVVNRKFIVPNMCWQNKRLSTSNNIETTYGGDNYEFIDDLVKALCYMTGDPYEKQGHLRNHINYTHKIIFHDNVRYYTTYQDWEIKEAKKQEYEAGRTYEEINYKPVYGEWFTFSFFRIKAYKVGSMHFEFLDKDVWAMFNQNIARIKGFTLFEGKKHTKYQDRMTGRGKKKAA